MTVDGRSELLVFAFEGPRVSYEGRVLGALERAESGGAIRIREVLLVER